MNIFWVGKEKSTLGKLEDFPTRDMFHISRHPRRKCGHWSGAEGVEFIYQSQLSCDSVSHTISCRWIRCRLLETRCMWLDLCGIRIRAMERGSDLHGERFSYQRRYWFRISDHQWSSVLIHIMRRCISRHCLPIKIWVQLKFFGLLCL